MQVSCFFHLKTCVACLSPPSCCCPEPAWHTPTSHENSPPLKRKFQEIIMSCLETKCIKSDLIRAWPTHHTPKTLLYNSHWLKKWHWYHPSWHILQHLSRTWVCEGEGKRVVPSLNTPSSIFLIKQANIITRLDHWQPQSLSMIKNCWHNPKIKSGPLSMWR